MNHKPELRRTTSPIALAMTQMKNEHLRMRVKD